MESKKNKIWIGHNGLGYCVRYNGELPGDYCGSYRWPGNSGFHDLINLLSNTADEFYQKGIELRIEKHSTTKIPAEERRTIETIVGKIEKICIRNKKLSSQISHAQRSLFKLQR
jgi:hypothetical protein